MTSDFVLDVVQKAVWTAVETGGPMLGLGIAVGLFASIMQAATQIQEPGLTFVPKLMALGVGLMYFGSWCLERMVTFCKQMFTAIGNLP